MTKIHMVGIDPADTAYREFQKKLLEEIAKITGLTYEQMTGQLDAVARGRNKVLADLKFTPVTAIEHLEKRGYAYSPNDGWSARPPLASLDLSSEDARAILYLHIVAALRLPRGIAYTAMVDHAFELSPNRYVLVDVGAMEKAPEPKVKPSTVRVRLEGPQGAGKTRILDFLRDAVRAEGFRVDDEAFEDHAFFIDIPDLNDAHLGLPAKPAPDDFNQPPEDLAGTILKHAGNGKTYQITGLVWLGETDRWGYLHRAVGEHGPMIARPLSHIKGSRRNGAPRYEEVLEPHPMESLEAREMAYLAGMSEETTTPSLDPAITVNVRYLTDAALKAGANADVVFEAGGDVRVSIYPVSGGS